LWIGVFLNLEDTEKVLNVCFANNLSILVVGDNGIGKTEMLRAMQKCFKRKSVALNAIDYGGMTTLNIPEKVKIAVISDMNVIMSRKKTRESTLGGMAALMTDYGMESVAYNNRGFNRKTPLSFIVACTPLQLFKMVRYGYHDILQRFLVVFLEREESDFREEGFMLPFPPQKAPKLRSKTPQNAPNWVQNARFRVILCSLFNGMADFGWSVNIGDIAIGLSSTNKKISIKELRSSFNFLCYKNPIPAYPPLSP
jgi:hypothetical protein